MLAVPFSFLEQAMMRRKQLGKGSSHAVGVAVEKGGRARLDVAEQGKCLLSSYWLLRCPGTATSPDRELIG